MALTTNMGEKRRLFESVMLKADLKTAQTIEPHCVQSIVMGCAVEFRLWRLGTCTETAQPK